MSKIECLFNLLNAIEKQQISSYMATKQLDELYAYFTARRDAYRSLGKGKHAIAMHQYAMMITNAKFDLLKADTKSYSKRVDLVLAQ